MESISNAHCSECEEVKSYLMGFVNETADPYITVYLCLDCLEKASKKILRENK